MLSISCILALFVITVYDEIMGSNTIVARLRDKVFPHIARIFPARVLKNTFSASFFVFFLGFFGVNIFVSHNFPQPYASYREMVLERPFSIKSYLQFGDILYRRGNRADAHIQMAIAENVLGAQTELNNVLSEWDYAYGAKKRTYDYWKQIVSKYPEYRDGLIQLAQASYNLARFEEAKAYLTQAQTLDPNNTLIVRMQKEMEL